MRNTGFLAWVVTVIACGNGDITGVDAVVSNPNEVSGDVNGQAFDAKDATWNQFSHTNGFGFSGTAAFVSITDYPGSCALDAQDQAPTNSLILDLGVAVNDASAMSSVPMTAGVFTVVSPTDSLPASANVAQAYYGSGCSKDVAYMGTSGTVTITTVHQDGSYDGTFDVTISCSGFSNCVGPDARLTGTFSSATCSSLDVNKIPGCLQPATRSSSSWYAGRNTDL